MSRYITFFSILLMVLAGKRILNKKWKKICNKMRYRYKVNIIERKLSSRIDWWTLYYASLCIIFITGSAALRKKKIERRDNRHARVISCRAEPVRDLIEIGRESSRRREVHLFYFPRRLYRVIQLAPDTHPRISLSTLCQMCAFPQKKRRKTKNKKGLWRDRHCVLKYWWRAVRVKGNHTKRL